MKDINIIVLIKNVPNTTKVKIDQNTGNLIREGVDSIINPDDLYAIETSITLRDLYGGGHIIAITMGPSQSIDALSEAIGMGVDSGILLSDKAFSGSDTWATSQTLGKAINRLNYDLILCGKQAIDGDTAQVGPQVAAFLDIPQITCVFETNFTKNKRIKVKRKTDYGYDYIQCNLPILLSISSSVNQPRYPIVSKLINACKKNAPIKIWNAADIGVKVSEVGMHGSLTQVIKTFSPNFGRQNQILEGSLPVVIETLFCKMKENKLI